MSIIANIDFAIAFNCIVYQIWQYLVCLHYRNKGKQILTKITFTITTD